jgi:ubiquinone biosynthesis protein
LTGVKGAACAAAKVPAKENPMLMGLAGTARDLGRAAEIAAVLARYGFGELLHGLGLAHDAQHAEDAASAHGRSAAERLRHALEELGPTFVKLGQLLATRVDLLAPEWIAQMEKLQDRAPAAPWEEVRAQLAEDLGADPQAVFAAFESEPIAAGSVAQVHRACLADGTLVAVKVRRPGIRARVEADLSLLARLAGLAEQRLPELARFRPREVVRQFSQTLRNELDFAAECRAAERVAHSFREQPEVVVPAVYWKWTGERINVQELIQGIPSRDLEAIDAAGLDRSVLARRGARAVLKMVLEDGFFHADPHQGNLFYLEGERIAFIDFGMTGHLGAARRDELVRLLRSLVGRDAEGAVEVLLDWADGQKVDAEAVTADVDAFIDRYHGLALAQLRAGAMLSDLTRLLREHGLALPPDLALVLKVCVALESVGRELDENFDMVAEAAPFLESATAQRFGPRALAQRGWRAAGTALELLAELPGDLRRLLRSARRSGVSLRVDLVELDRFGHQLDRAASRLTVGVVVAALIIGSSIVMTVQGGPTLLGLPFFGLLGFLGAVAGSLWLLFSIWRGGKEKP